MSEHWRKKLDPIDRGFICFEEHRVRRWSDDFGSDAVEEEIAQTEALKGWATDLGLCVLQGQQLEYGLRMLCDQLQVLDPTQSSRLEAGRLLEAVKFLVPEDKRELLNEAVQIRNRLIHGKLFIGIASQGNSGIYEEIGVDTWSHRGDTVLFERQNADRERWQRASGSIDEVETLEDWLVAMAAATLTVVDLLPDSPELDPEV